MTTLQVCCGFDQCIALISLWLVSEEAFGPPQEGEAGLCLGGSGGTHSHPPSSLILSPLGQLLVRTETWGGGLIIIQKGEGMGGVSWEAFSSRGEKSPESPLILIICGSLRPQQLFSRPGRPLTFVKLTVNRSVNTHVLMHTCAQMCMHTPAHACQVLVTTASFS